MATYPYPDENTAVKAFQERVRAEYEAAGRRFPDPGDPDAFRHFSRYGYSCHEMPEPQAADKHIAELHAELESAGPRPPDPGPVPPGDHRRIQGQLKVDRQVFLDDAGTVLPILCHFGEAFSAYVRRPDDVRAQLDVIAAAGYQGIRFWDVLGYHDQNRPGEAPWRAWAGREVTPIPFTAHSGRQIPATPQYYDKLTLFLRVCQERGLVVQHSRGDLNAFTWPQVQEHCTQVGRVQRTVGLATIAVNEACNESWQNGVRDPKQLQAMIERINNPATLSGSSAADDGYGGELPESVDAYTMAIGMDTHIVHGYRGGASLNRISHIHALGYATLPERNVTAWQGEPAGPGEGVSVGKEDHPEALCLMAAMALSTRQGWVYMSGHGVFWNGPIEQMTAFYDVVRVPALLPADIMTWAKIIHGGATWRSVRVLVAHEGNNAGLVYRADHVLHADGRQFVCLVYGPQGSYNVPIERSFEGEIITPHTGERHPIRGTAGGTLRLDFARGRIIVGRTATAVKAVTPTWAIGVPGGRE